MYVDSIGAAVIDAHPVARQARSRNLCQKQPVERFISFHSHLIPREGEPLPARTGHEMDSGRSHNIVYSANVWREDISAHERRRRKAAAIWVNDGYRDQLLE
jgi:hypothetical protein